MNTNVKKLLSIVTIVFITSITILSFFQINNGNNVELLEFYKYIYIIISIFYCSFVFFKISKLLNSVDQLISFSKSLSEGKVQNRLIENKSEYLYDINVAINGTLNSLTSTMISKQYFEAILQKMNDILIIVGEDKIIKNVNKSFLRSLGYSKSEIIGKNITSVILNEYLDKFSIKNVEKKTCVFIGKEGTLNVNYSSFSINVNGESRDIILARDVSEESRFNSKIVQSAKLSSIGELAGGVAHEINNPLTIIKGNLGILKRKVEETHNDRFDKIYRALERITYVVKNLGSYAGFEDETTIIDVNFHNLIKSTTELVDKIFDKQGITFELNLSATNFTVFGNRLKLQQVIMNLIINSKDAILESSQLNGIIKIDTVSDDEHIIFTISDNGIGIKQNELIKIFDMFYSTKQDQSSTGLGLSMVQNVVNELDGDIQVNSIYEKGTVFQIKIIHKERFLNKIM